MADVIGAAEFELRASTDKLMKDVRDSERDLKQSIERVERDYAKGGRESAAAFARGQRQMVQDAKRAEGEIRRSASGISTALAAAAGAFAGTISVSAIISLSDSYTRFANALRVAGVEGADFARVQDALAATAIKNGVQLEGLAQLYGRASQSAKELGASQADLLKFTQGVSAALRVQGGDASSAQGALLQLSQALAAGTVRAEEFNSVNEGARPILEAVAKGSDRFKGSVAALRAAVLEGKVTSQEFFAAFLKGSADLEERAAKAPLTVAQGFTNLQSALVLYVGESDVSKGATEALANAISLLAKNLDLIIPTLAAITVGVGTAYVSGAIAATGATGILTGAMGGLRVAMTAISTHPIIAVLTVIAAGLAFVAVRGREASAATAELDRAAEGTRAALAEYEKAAIAAAGATKENAAEARANAEAMREEAIAAVNSARALRERTKAAAAAAVQESEERARNPDGGRGERSLFAARARGAQVTATRAAIDAFMAEGELAEIERRIKAGAGGGGGGGGGAGGDRAAKAARDNADQIAARRAELDLEEDIARARASGDEAAIKAAEERQKLAQLTRQYESAGYEDANARAIQHLALLNQAEKLIEDRAAAEKEVDRILAGRERQLEREADNARTLNDQIRDRLRFEAELARLGRSEDVIKAAERRLFIEERTNEILRLRLALTRAEAEAMAGGEFEALESADRIGRMREEFRYAFTDGIKAAIDGDLGSFFESLADRFTDRMLDNLADDLFDLLSQAAKGFSQSQGSGGIFSAIGNFLGSTFGGGRASGGPMMGGNWFRVGEHGPENIVMPRDGFAIPAGALAGAPSGGGRQTVEHTVRVVPERESFIRLAGDTASPMVQEGSAGAFSASRATVPADMAMKSRYTRGRK